MSDYIKREDAIKAIEKDVMVWLNYESILNRLSSADVAEVVRCKDCKWAGRDEHCPAIEVYMICGDNGYCSCGERKEQDDE